MGVQEEIAGRLYYSLFVFVQNYWAGTSQLVHKLKE